MIPVLFPFMEHRERMNRRKIGERLLCNLHQKYQYSDYGVITTYDPSVEENENLKRMGVLKTFIIDQGFSVTLLNGTVRNKGKARFFLIFDRNNTGLLRSCLVRWGSNFGQDSILFHSSYDGKDYIIGTNKSGTVFPMYNDSMPMPRPLFREDGLASLNIIERPFTLSAHTVIHDFKHGYDDVITNYDFKQARIIHKYTVKFDHPSKKFS